VRLQEQLYLTETRPLRDEENGAKVSETLRRRREAELEVEVKRLQNDFSVAEASREEAWLECVATAQDAQG